MKGQYLAVETVFVFGIGLMLAIGIVSIFDSITSNILDDVRPEQAETVSSKVEVTMRSLKQADEGSDKSSRSQVDLDVPESLAGTDYTLILSNHTLVVDMGSESFENEIEGFRDYSFDGSVSGGSATIFKSQNKFTLRAN